jgi:hypothetical protein
MLTFFSANNSFVLDCHLSTTMVGLKCLALLNLAMVSMTSAAGGGTKEEYDSGAVHARLMSIKMVG